LKVACIHAGFLFVLSKSTFNFRSATRKTGIPSLCPQRLPIFLHYEFGRVSTSIMFLDIIHCLVFIYNTKFRRLDSVSVFRQNLLCWAQSIELVLNLPSSQIWHFIW
jgi:hypothetical protein